MDRMKKHAGQITVRRAKESDILTILHIVTNCYWEEGYLSRNCSLGEYPDIQDPNNESFVVEHNGQVIGTALIRYRRGNHLPLRGDFVEEAKCFHGDSCVAYIGHLAIIPRFRNGPACRELFKVITYRCILHWVQSVVCEAHPKKFKFYTNLGFTCIGNSQYTQGLETPANLFHLSLKKWLWNKTMMFLGLKEQPQKAQQWRSAINLPTT